MSIALLTPSPRLLALLDAAKERGPEIGARRRFVLAAAAGTEPVPLTLRDACNGWVKATVAARHGFAHDVHLGLLAFALAHALGLPNMSTLDAFHTMAHAAADTLACLAGANLLTQSQQKAGCCGWLTTLRCRSGLIAWLERSLVESGGKLVTCARR